MTLLALVDGSLFAGRYRVTRCIAQGGMGAVYEAIHAETERVCALKVMLPDMLQSQEMRDRFRQEARVAAHIRSEHIVDVFDAGVDDATSMPFLVMELLQGEELSQRLRRVGRLSAEEVATYIHQAALALDKTHKASIVHRDLKPGNLFLTEREDGTPQIKLLDFGIAKLVAEGTMNTTTTSNLGTPMYMSPEQFGHSKQISPASDVYALGMVAFTLLVGAPYWQDEMSGKASVYAFVATAMAGPKESACARAARRGVTLPPEFDAWFAKVTAFAPADRFRTASSAAAALADVLNVPLAVRRSLSPVSARSGALPIDSQRLSPRPAPSLPGLAEPIPPSGADELPAAMGDSLPSSDSVELFALSTTEPSPDRIVGSSMQLIARRYRRAAAATATVLKKLWTAHTSQRPMLLAIGITLFGLSLAVSAFFLSRPKESGVSQEAVTVATALPIKALPGALIDAPKPTPAAAPAVTPAGAPETLEPVEPSSSAAALEARPTDGQERESADAAGGATSAPTGGGIARRPRAAGVGAATAGTSDTSAAPAPSSKKAPSRAGWSELYRRD